MLYAESQFFQGPQIPVGNAIVYALIGIAGVFLVLAVLIGLLYLFQTLFKFNVLDKIGGRFKKKNKPAPQEKTQASAPAASQDEDPDEIAAVISAVISAMYVQESGEPAPFVIRNIKRK